MTALTHLTMAGALDGLARKDFTAVELTEAHVRAGEAVRPFNIFITETPDAARSMAKACAERRSNSYRTSNSSSAKSLLKPRMTQPEFSRFSTRPKRVKRLR